MEKKCRFPLVLRCAFASIPWLLTACQDPKNPTADGPSSDGTELATAFATAPAGFQDAIVTSSLGNSTAMDIAPDGRVFVCEQAGRVRVVKGGALLTTPFVTIGSTSANGERGLVGIALDPNFPSGPYVYLYYTYSSSPIHNRISRFTVSSSNADVADPASELVLLDLDPLSTATNHNGGGMHFGPDGKLYIGVGENANGSNSQSLSTVLGKILRINKDGTIPSDNPFVSSTSGKNKAIWAMGLRNPFTSAFQPGTGRYFINDVGENTWEEIDDGIAGRNYGWPSAEGASSNTAFTNPLYTYSHSGGDCAITGGAFYNPATVQFPSDYVGNYLFCDYCGGWIKRIDPATKQVSAFITGIPSPVDVKVDRDGSLYCLTAGGSLHKITNSSSQAPAISQQPASVTVTQGGSATFTVSASGGAPLAYQWQRDGAGISGATAASYTLSGVQAADNGAKFRCIVSNASGSATSNDAILTVTGDQAPTAAITAPSSGSTYSGGQVVNYAGTGTDPEEGSLPDSDYTWIIVFHHDTHTHPFLGPIQGVKSGSFTVPTQGETSSNVWYRIHLYVKDSQGMVDSTYRDVLPLKANLTLASSPAGLQLLLDGQPVTAPYTFTGVVGMQRSLGAASPQALGGKSYQFASWSDGGAQSHVITTPSAATTYTAAFTEAAPPSNLPPTDTILTPVVGSKYGGGSVIWYSGSGKDPEQGALPGTAFTWKVDYYHDGVADPFLAAWSGPREGSFNIPTTPASASPSAFYRLTLTVRDNQGLTATAYRDILPRQVNVTLTSSPIGLQVLLDGQSVTTPYAFTGIVGMNRNLEAPLNETLNGANWKFDYWSNGQPRVQVLSTPDADKTYGANYVAVSGGGGGTAPAITGQPAGVTVTAGSPATFSVTASGTAPLAYQWQRNASDIPGATAASYTLASAQSGDNGARFRCAVTNAYGSATSNEAVLTVGSGSGSNLPPTDTILTPTVGSKYGGGSVIWYTGAGNDPEDGSLPASAFTWKVDYYHDGAADPFLAPWTGTRNGSFTIPTTAASASTSAYYRLTLTVRDNQGSTATVYRDILPRTVTVTLSSSPTGLQLLLDGQSVTAPYTFTGIVGMNRNLEAPLNQTLSGQGWKFDYWSNGQPRVQVLSTPDTDKSYGANYLKSP